ncbi:MAG TPA: PAS domain-containing protein, partial [Rhizomicrobium sp.]|nr:PAS domain-containing protein [Rhizomicrobium sp.]
MRDWAQTRLKVRGGTLAFGVAAAGVGVFAGAASRGSPAAAVMMLGALMAVLGTAVALLEALATRSDPRKTAAERSYTAFFDHALEGIFRSTVTGQYLDVNPALARIYGYESREDLMIGL